MNEKLAEALGYVDERLLPHAAKKRHKKKILLTAVAAMLALVFFWQSPTIPLVISAQAVSRAPESRLGDRPARSGDKWKEWLSRSHECQDRVKEILPAVVRFSGETSREVLTDPEGKNRVWSPVNAYIGLAMTAELTGSETRESVLQALGVDSIDGLREGVGAIWESVYRNNNLEICTLANSLWLDEALDYSQETMDAVSQYYYADVYRDRLGSSGANRAMTHWLRNQTGGFLKDRSGKVQMEPQEFPVLCLLSTIYFQSKWQEKFQASNNTEDLFHSPSGDRTVTFMNAREMEKYYYWDPDFGAIGLSLNEGDTMWLILPDEDKTPNDVLRSGSYMELITSDGTTENKKYVKVNLSLPKFDISAGADLKEPLTALGMGELFGSADFSPSIQSDIPVRLSSVHQDTRVAIDEEGVTAASYLEGWGCGAAEPPQEIIDFVLDRPFVFAITSRYGVPLFVGTVQEP